MSNHKEISFENEIRDYLAASGWLYAESDAQQYDRARALFPADALAWVNPAQGVGSLEQESRCQCRAVLLDRLRKSLNNSGQTRMALT